MERRTAPGLVGRRAELSRLEDAVASAAAGRGAIALVAGEAGIGKTRLVSELCERVRPSGSTVLSGCSIAVVGSGLPYLPLVEALRPLHGAAALDELTADLHELIGLVPELGDADRAPTPRTRADPQLRLFQETVELLDRLSEDQPVVLLLEDLHWADASTLALLSYLAHAVPDHRILVVATYRIEELGEGLSHLVLELERSGAATLVELAPLSDRDLAQLLSDASDETLDPALVASICARSEGNPFFAEELLAAGRDDEASIPPVLRDVLLQRFDQLGGEARGVLRVAAASSRDITYRLLAAVAPYDANDLVEALREAVEGGVLVADAAAGTFRFRHALLSEAIYSTVLPGEREGIHTRWAQALSDDPASAASSLSGELAHHWAAAGRAVEALRASVAAAREAEAVAGWTEALRHLERVLELWPQVGDAEAVAGLDLVEVLRWTAEIAYSASAAGRAAELMHQAVALPYAQTDPVQLGLMHARLAFFLLAIGERAAGMAAFERSLGLVPAEPPSAERATVLGAYGRGLMIACRYDEAKTACEQALAVAAAIGDERPTLRARAVLGHTLFLRGSARDGEICLRRARELAREYNSIADELRTYVFLSDALLIAGRLAAAADDALEGLAMASRHGYLWRLGAGLGANAAEALFGLGEWSRATELLATTMRDADADSAGIAHLTCAQLALGRGRLEQASEHLELGAGYGDQKNAKASYRVVEVELALWEGRSGDALAVVDRMLRDTEPSDLWYREPHVCALGLRALVELVRAATLRRDAGTVTDAQRRGRMLLERARRSAARAAAVSPEAHGWAAVAEAEHTRVEGSPSPEHWQNATAIWAQHERPYLAAYCRWRLAEALLATGAPRIDAAVPAREAHRVAQRLGATLLVRELEQLARRARLDLAGADASALPDEQNTLGLTAREREVLQLLARGYTNRELAAELVISVKTASVHVSHILRKLDVASRLEAAEIAQRLTPPPPARED